MLIRPRRGSPNRHMSEATSHRIPQNLLSWQGRDGLARLHRAGELTAVWIPDEALEVLRDFSV